MTKRQLDRYVWALKRSLDELKNDLETFQGPAYDEEYKVREWYPHLTEAKFALVIGKMGDLEAAIAELQPGMVTAKDKP